MRRGKGAAFLALVVAVGGCRAVSLSRQAASGAMSQLVAAARAGDTATLQQLIQDDPGLPHATFTGAEGPVGAAAANDKIEALRVLTEAGAELRERDLQGQTPLHLAKTAAVASFLIEHGVSVDVRTQSGVTPLMTASSTPEVVEVLLRAGARTGLRDDGGLTALHHVGNSGAPTALEGAALLCAHGADPDVADEKGENARGESARISAELPGNQVTGLVSRFLAKGGGCDRLREKTGGRGGVDQDTIAAEVQALRCDSGNVWACGRLGLAYEKGTGVAKDLARSAQLYTQSCEGGHEWGCYALGYAYAEGEGVAKDAARAVALFEKACDAKYLPACSQLGYRLEKGQGTKRDDPRAAALYARACEGDEAWACWRLSEAYAAGRGVPADASRAATLRAKACKGGEERACAAAKPR